MGAPYQRLAAELRHLITAGDWPPGTRIPSARALQDEYGVGRGVVERAIMQLKREGLLEGIPGARLRVAYPPAPRTLVAPDADWPYGRGDVEVGRGVAGAELAARLGCGPRVRVVRRRVECLDPGGRPAMLVTTWQRTVRPVWHEAVRCEVRPHQLTAVEAAALGLATGAPALLVERTRYGPDGVPVQTADLVLPADRWRIGW